MYPKLLKAVKVAILFSAVSLSGADSASENLPQNLLDRARSGDVQAQLEAGFSFYRQNQPIKAAYWFAAAARAGSPAAQYNLGRCYMEGYGVKKDLHQAWEYFQQAAAQKLPEAELMLAKLYLSGIAANPDAVPPRAAIAADEAAGVKLLEKLSQAKFTEANIVYAGYLISRRQAPSPEKVIELLDAAVQANSTAGEIMLADFLLSRKDKFRDEKRARKLLEKAAPQSNEAKVKLAFAIENGFGAAPDLQQAGTLYEAALKEKFSPLAALQLANYVLTGRGGIAQDIPYAVELYTRAAEAGLPEAIYQLGECSRLGLGMKQDADAAFKYFFQSAQKNYAPAQFATAEALAAGAGTPQDQAAAFYWYNQAAVNYEPRALLETGKRCLYGTGTAPDPARAVIYLEQALANGMNEAALLLPEARKRAAKSSILPRELPEFKLRPNKQ